MLLLVVADVIVEAKVLRVHVVTVVELLVIARHVQHLDIVQQLAHAHVFGGEHLHEPIHAGLRQRADVVRQLVDGQGQAGQFDVDARQMVEFLVRQIE